MYEKLIKEIDGRFEVALPFNQKEIALPNNYTYALNRMLKLEHRFKKNKSLQSEFLEFMGKLLQEKHAVLLPDNDLHTPVSKI